MPDETFWGLGPQALERQKTEYAQDVVAPFAEISTRHNQHMSLEWRVGLEYNKVAAGNGDAPSIEQLHRDVAGVGSETTLATASGTVLLDTRDRLGSPRSGWKAVLRAQIYVDLGDEGFDFTKVTTELIRYLEVYPGRVVLVRVGAVDSRPLGNGAVPLFRLSEIGDEATTMRGFERGRFRDRQAIFGGLEYRYPIWRFFDGLLFANAGQVGRELPADLDVDHAQFAYGAGMRWWQTSGAAARILLSRSSDGTTLQLYMTSSF